MKKIKSYTNVWAVKKVIHVINDFQLSFPVASSQMTWFVLSLLFVIIFAHVLPLSMTEGAFLKYLGISMVVTWFMSQKALDGKKPLESLRSFLSHHLWFKVTSAGKKVREQKKRWDESITLARSVNYVLD